MLRARGRRVVIVGGGAVARRRAVSLVEAGAEVFVIAPRIDPTLESTVGVTMERRAYREGDLEGALIAVIATDRPAVNERAAAEARERGVLVNRADVPEEGDFSVPAHRRVGPITLAVHSGGGGPRAAAAIRDHLIEAMDEDWIMLLQTLRPYRERVKRTITDPERRRAVLRRLTSEDAMQTLKNEGVEGLKAWCEEVTVCKQAVRHSEEDETAKP